jgi:nucleotide-binding universal stress UspA family protein
MKLGSKVLVATDLSEAADEAIRQGHERARLEGGELVVCHVVPDMLRYNPLFPQRASAEMAGLLESEQQAAKAVELRVVALTGRPIDGFRLHVETDAVKATLVVVSSRGTAGLDRMLLGSVAARVVRYAHCPVLVARPHEKTGRVLAATDFSDPALPAVAAAVEEARVRGARLTLLHSVDGFPNPAIGWGAPFGASWVVPPQELVDEVRKSAESALRSTLERFGVEGDPLVAEGDAASAILEAARALPAELVVLATRGRTGITRMVLGSVAERVVATAPCSVLAVRLG